MLSNAIKLSLPRGKVSTLKVNLLDNIKGVMASNVNCKRVLNVNEHEALNIFHNKQIQQIRIQISWFSNFSLPEYSEYVI